MPSLHDLLGPSDGPPARPATRPYAPTKRVSPPGSVMVPITRLELVQSQNSANPLRTYQRTPPVDSASGGLAGTSNGLPKRPMSAAEDRDDGQAKRTRIAENTTLVASHYNARPNIDRHTRNDSPIIGLKNFNNWIKSVLIHKFGRRVDGTTGRLQKVKVLDLGCGKGGDLQKWSKANTDEYYGLDLAVVSIEQARSRWEQMRDRQRFRAHFIQADCFQTDIGEVLEPHQVDPLFDVVSMQFCMHYAFETEAKARQMLSNVSKFLKPGGVFLGTIPDSDKLMDKLSEIPADEGELAFGNSVYGIKFDERDWTEQFGHRYTFFLQDAVEEVPEYVVHWDAFVDLAREYDLHVIFKADFQDIFIEEKDQPEFADLLKKMRVLDRNGETEMTTDQWEAATIYLGFAMAKVGEKESELFR